jgi:pSer/pThr/pTyr-binding forkhead associated (FHA) protein
MAKLALWIDGADDARILDTEALPPGTIWRIGRGSGPPLTTICLKNQYVSQRHSALRYEPELGLWQIADTNSMNGTFVSGKRITSNWHSLKDNDRITAGECWIIVSTDPRETLGKHKTMAGEGADDDAKLMKNLGWADVAALILTGPSGFPSWAWWLLLLGAGVGVAWIWRR